MANLRNRLFGCYAIFILFSALSGCGGEAADGLATGGGAIYPSKTLSWTPPTTYSDSAPLDPAQELEAYEIYVDETGTFSDASSPMAEAAAVDPGNGQLCTSFDLANLAPFLSQGVTYHVSIRAVAVSGLKSGFSAAASFSF